MSARTVPGSWHQRGLVSTRSVALTHRRHVPLLDALPGRRPLRLKRFGSSAPRAS
jgi:hypothetical protein